MSWWVEVDGLVLPRQIAGHPALELVNTRAGWAEPDDAEQQDYLRDYDHLLTSAVRDGLVPSKAAEPLRLRVGREPDAAATEVDRARRLRTDLHAVLTGTATRAATERLGRAITRARSRQQLELSPTPRWRFAGAEGAPGLADPLDSYLIAAGELLTAGPRIGACPGHGCGWLFLNPSGRRRWCQMAVCGNRAKQAAHARRR